MFDEFNVLADSLVRVGDKIDFIFNNNETDDQIINHINKSKELLNKTLYECAKSIEDIKNTLNCCIEDIEKKENKLGEDERIQLESFFLEIDKTQNVIVDELNSLNSKLNRIADNVLPYVWIGGED